MLLRSADAMIRFESDVGGILKEVLDLLPAHVPLTGSYDEYGSADYMFVVKDGLPSVNINRNTITYTGEVDTSLLEKKLDIVFIDK